MVSDFLSLLVMLCMNFTMNHTQIHSLHFYVNYELSNQVLIFFCIEQCVHTPYKLEYFDGNSIEKKILRRRNTNNSFIMDGFPISIAHTWGWDFFHGGGSLLHKPNFRKGGSIFMQNDF